MNAKDSFFSFIKRPEAAAPQPAPQPEPQLHAQKVPDNLAAKLAELEQKISDAAKSAGAMTEGLHNELQLSKLRISGLERSIAALQKELGEAVREKREAEESAAKAQEQFRGDLAVLRYRADSAEELCRGLSLANSDGKLSETLLKKLEGGLASELRERFLALDAAIVEISRKAGLAQETSAGNARRLDDLEDRAAKLSYLENRLEGNERKFERLYDLEALAQALKVNVENVESRFAAVARDAAGISEEQRNFRSDFASVSHQVKQLTALFGYFRTELSFLLPKSREGAAADRGNL